jgi:primosomal protein N'
VEQLLGDLVSYEDKISLGHSAKFSTYQKSKFQLQLNEFALVPGCLPSSISKAWAKLNAEQKTAVTKILGMRDYALVQGMPGTGKTATIAMIVQLLVR